MEAGNRPRRAMPDLPGACARRASRMRVSSARIAGSVRSVPPAVATSVNSTSMPKYTTGRNAAVANTSIPAAMDRLERSTGWPMTARVSPSARAGSRIVRPSSRRYWITR